MPLLGKWVFRRPHFYGPSSHGIDFCYPVFKIAQRGLVMRGNKRSDIGLMLERFSLKATKATGTSWAFVIAVVVLIVWGISGPLFNFSDTWQLVINTGTTIVTFLMVFLIQRTQNKDAQAIHLKLNEIVAAMEGASNRLIDVEDPSEDNVA